MVVNYNITTLSLQLVMIMFTIEMTIFLEASTVV